MEFEFSDEQAGMYGETFNLKYAEAVEAAEEGTEDTVLIGHACLFVVQEILNTILLQVAENEETESDGE